MANRYVVLTGGSASTAHPGADLGTLVAGACGLTLRRLELSFASNTASNLVYHGSFGLARGLGATGGTSHGLPNSVEDPTPIPALASVKDGASLIGPTQILAHWLVPVTQLYVVDLEGPNGITLLPGNSLALSFTAADDGNWTINANIWFEE